MASTNLLYKSPLTLNANGHLLALSTPLVMGILNVTSDSFYAGSRVTDTEAIVNRAAQMLAEGASILDIGGYSSRPGATDISVDEELSRVIPAITAIRAAYPEAVISIDTFRAKVAQEAIKAGAAIVNDISGGEADLAMFDTLSQLQVPYILMHMRGTPQTMNSLTNYSDLLLEMLAYFQEKINRLQALGVKDIVIDPGFGFAKTIAQNYELIKKINYFNILNKPLLVGISRKSMIYKTLKIPATEALNGTTVLNTLLLSEKISILRVHDVKAAYEAVVLAQEAGY